MRLTQKSACALVMSPPPPPGYARAARGRHNHGNFRALLRHFSLRLPRGQRHFPEPDPLRPGGRFHGPGHLRRDVADRVDVSTVASGQEEVVGVSRATRAEENLEEGDDGQIYYTERVMLPVAD